MKRKYFITACLLLLGVLLYAQSEVINVGTVANDQTGDPLRIMGQKINANFAAVRDSFANALDADLYYFERSDTGYTHGQIITYDQLQAAIVGLGGDGTTADVLQFIVGVTAGAPSACDSIITHADFAGKDVAVYRGLAADMHKQYYNSTSTNTRTGYRKSGNTVVVRPVFSSNEMVRLETATYNYLNFGTNSLLTGLMGYWRMDEASGTTMADAHTTGVDGTITSVTLHQTGVINYAYRFNGSSANVSLGNNCQPTSALSISLWFNTADVTNEQQLIGNLYYIAGGWAGYRISIAADGHINFVIGTGTSTMLDKSTPTTGLDDGAWHHVVCTWNGSNAYIYIDNNKSSASVMSTPAAYGSGSTLRLGSNAGASGMFYGGLMDEVGIWNKGLTDAEVSILFSKRPYNFN